MYRNFDGILNAACAMKQKKTAVIAAAAEDKLLRVAADARKMGLCGVILVDDAAAIRRIAGENDIDLGGCEIVDEKDPTRTGVTAVSLVSSDRGDIFVKGRMNTGDFLRAVLNKEVGFRTGRKLSMMTAYDVETEKKLFFMTDGGMMIAPDLSDKADILRNAVGVLHNMGIAEPKVAILSANERVSPNMQSTVDADALCKMAARGELPKAIYEGPIAFDVAMRPDAAAEKGIDSRVSGDVDLFLVPNIETGNCVGKAIGYFTGAQGAGIVVGAAKPAVMSSRSSSAQSKLVSIAWALLACGA